MIVIHANEGDSNIVDNDGDGDNGCDGDNGG